MRQILTFAGVSMLAIALTGCGSEEQSSKADTQVKAPTALASYQAQAQDLLTNIRAQQADGDIASEAAQLVATSTTLIDQFITKYPHCSEYLNAVKAAAEMIPNLALDVIETDYHADGALPKFSDPNCYHAKDLLVHPATVQAMANQGINTDELRESAAAEIVEVIAHFGQVEQALAKQ